MANRQNSKRERLSTWLNNRKDTIRHMVLGGLHKNSFIDYPGKISCVLFMSGCNFDCPYCHNPDLAKGCTTDVHKNQSNDLFDLLEKRKSFLDGVVISGGEPTIQSDLISLCEKVKNLGYPVKLDTNGSRPSVVQELLENGLVDYIAMDIKTDPFSYSPWITKNQDPGQLLSSIHIIMKSGIPYEFKTTCIQPLINEDIIRKISCIIEGAQLYALQEFQNSDVLHPEFFREEKQCYDKNALLYFKSIADPWVEKCIVR
jgi:pyruvate formate lyase activating enzyme